MGGWIVSTLEKGYLHDFTTLARPMHDMTEVHVYPHEDLVIHELSKDCACIPEILESGVISHNSWDGREEQEVTTKC